MQYIIKHKKKVKMYVKIEKTKYKKYTVKYSKKRKGYIYTFHVKSLKTGDKVVATAKNKGGKTKSKKFKWKK